MGERWSITFAASRPDVLAVEVVAAGQVIPQPVERSELSDAEADAVLASRTPDLESDRRRQARAAATDDEVMYAIFGDTLNVSTPAEARELFGGA